MGSCGVWAVCHSVAMTNATYSHVHIIPADVTDLATKLDDAAITAGGAAPPNYTPAGWAGTKTAAALAKVGEFFADQAKQMSQHGGGLARQARITAAAFAESDAVIAAAMQEIG